MNPCPVRLPAGLLLLVGLGSLTATVGGVELVSARHHGALAIVTGNGESSAARISPDGQFVAFSSMANDLVAGDDNGQRVDLFLRDVANSQTWLISASVSGGNANGNSVSPMFSWDGKRIVFESTASNLVALPTKGDGDIYVRDLAAGLTRLVSVNATGMAGGNGASSNPRITPDGRFVVFDSVADDLVTGDANSLNDVFIRDLESGQTTRITMLDRLGRPVLTEGASSANVTPDGRYVVFQGVMTNQVWLRDLTANTNELISARPNGQFPTSNRSAYDAQVSDDGRYVAFISEATDLLATPFPNTTARAYRFDRQTRTMRMVVGVPAGGLTSALVTELVFSGDGSTVTCAFDGQVHQWREPEAGSVVVTIGTDGKAASRICDSVSVSADGSKIAFVSGATNLVDGLTTDAYRVYVADTVSRQIALAAKSSDGSTPADADCSFPSLSPDGSKVVFSAADGNLIENDTNGAQDVLLTDLDTGATELISVSNAANPSATAGGMSWASGEPVSSDGRFVLFTSLAPDVVPQDLNGGFDVFTRDLVAATNVLISANTNGVPANGSSQNPAFSPDGRFVAFISAGTDLSAEETNRFDDVYLRDLTAKTTRLASVGAATAATPGGVNSAVAPVVSAGGRFVAFVSPTRILPADGNSGDDLYVRDLESDTTIGATLQMPGAISRNFDPLQFCGTDGLLYLQDTNMYWFDFAQKTSVKLFSCSGRPAITPDCRWIAFHWSSRGTTRVSLYDLAARTTRDLITLTNPVPATLPAELRLALSADGRRLAFVDGSGRLSPVDGNETKDVYVLDTEHPTRITLVSANQQGTATGNGPSESPAISPDGAWVAFRSWADDLVPGDTNGKPDVFVRNLPTGTTYPASTGMSGEATGSDRSNEPTFAATGRFLVFNSFASNLVADDRNGSQDVFLYPLVVEAAVRAAILPLVAGGKPTITWNVAAGRRYAAEYVDELGREWKPLPGDAEPYGEGQMKHEDSSATGVATRFYRVVQLP